MGQEKKEGAYAAAGVNIAAAHEATSMMKAAVQATYTPEVLAGLGAFGGLFDAAALKEMARPILVASTDGVGTKTRVATRMNNWGTIGQDLVNHCINDILVQGARPLFFLDYVASSKLDPAQIATIVRGVAIACQAAGCALLGGETAERPGVYEEGEVDVVGTIIGVVDQKHLIDGSRIKAGNIILGLPSSGLHTNGYTLARSVLANESWVEPNPKLGRQSIGDALLATHRNYTPQIKQLRADGVDILGLAHITGGGFIDNLPRILPEGVAAKIERGRWKEPLIFQLIQELGNISVADMFHTFNMGIGMLVIVKATAVPMAKKVLGNGVAIIGEIVKGDGDVLVH